MIRYKTFIGHRDYNEESDKKISDFLETISIEGHTFISLNTVTSGQYHNNFRTEIVYRENITRKVLIEKESNVENN